MRTVKELQENTPELDFSLATLLLGVSTVQDPLVGAGLAIVAGRIATLTLPRERALALPALADELIKLQRAAYDREEACEISKAIAGGPRAPQRTITTADGHAAQRALEDLLAKLRNRASGE